MSAPSRSEQLLGVPAPTDPAQTGARLAGAAGILSAVLLFVAVAAVDIPHGASDPEITAWFSDAAHRRAYLLSSACLLFSGLLFLGYLGAVLARSVGAAGAAGTAGRDLARACGLLYVAMLFLAGCAACLVRGVVVDDEPLPGPDALHALTQLRYLAVGLYAMPVAAVCIGCVSYAVLRSGGMPRWFGWLGVLVVLVIAVAASVLVGQLAIPALLLWATAGGVVLLRRT